MKKILFSIFLIIQSSIVICQNKTTASLNDCEAAHEEYVQAENDFHNAFEKFGFFQNELYGRVMLAYNAFIEIDEYLVSELDNFTKYNIGQKFRDQYRNSSKDIRDKAFQKLHDTKYDELYNAYISKKWITELFTRSIQELSSSNVYDFAFIDEMVQNYPVKNNNNFNTYHALKEVIHSMNQLTRLKLKNKYWKLWYPCYAETDNKKYNCEKFKSNYNEEIDETVEPISMYYKMNFGRQRTEIINPGSSYKTYKYSVDDGYYSHLEKALTAYNDYNSEVMKKLLDYVLYKDISNVKLDNLNGSETRLSKLLNNCWTKIICRKGNYENNIVYHETALNTGLIENVKTNKDRIYLIYAWVYDMSNRERVDNLEKLDSSYKYFFEAKKNVIEYELVFGKLINQVKRKGTIQSLEWRLISQEFPDLADILRIERPTFITKNMFIQSQKLEEIKSQYNKFLSSNDKKNDEKELIKFLRSRT